MVKTGPLKEKLFGKDKNLISRSALTLNFDLGTCFTAHLFLNSSTPWVKRELHWAKRRENML